MGAIRVKQHYVLLRITANMPLFPGNTIRLGSQGEDVRLLQEYLNFIASLIPEIPSVRVTGYSGIFVDLCEKLQNDVIERMKG